MQPLPIDPLLPDLLTALESSPAVVLEAPPGAGKTTRVPWALLGAPRVVAPSHQIVVTEPRRIAARLAATRVASEHGEKVGQRVGYSVRFEDVSSSATRVRYVTEGVLLRRLAIDPKLAGVGAVVLDEFHERSMSADVILALVRRLQRAERSDLRLVVMSATLDADPLVSYLGHCPRLRSDGRLFEVTIEHQREPDDRPLEKQVVSAVRNACARDPAGSILVFLPGASEIRRAKDALEPLSREARFLLTPLHGDQPIAEQAKALEPSAERKVVLATNVAESSLTIDGVTAVVDSGLVRRIEYSPSTGLPRLVTTKASRASAIQRAGRAGRTAPGHVLRLYTQGDFARRSERDLPELVRADLSETWLLLYGADVSDPAALEFLDQPSPAAMSAAAALLRTLGALDDASTLTDIGRRMLDFPLHPRLARLVVEGERRGVGAAACLAAALLSERDIRSAARTDFGARSRPELDQPTGPSDVLELMDRMDEALAGPLEAARLRWLGLDARGVRNVEQSARKLERIARSPRQPVGEASDQDRELLRCILAGFVDRLARRREQGKADLALAAGGTAKLAETSVVRDAELLLALDTEQMAGKQSVVRLASAVEPEWLLDSYPERLALEDELALNPDTGRVERQSRLSIGSVVLEESRVAAKPSKEVARLIAQAALRAPRVLERLEALRALGTRLEVLRVHMPEHGVPVLPEESSVLEEAASTATSLGDIEQTDLVELVISQLGPHERRLLREYVPERIALPSGRSLVVHYEPHKPPWVASRLQDFFGLAESPRVCAGRVPLTLHLLAPSQRPVQVTNDLGGFWLRHYPAIRRELMRRYPKHAWPEDGRHAQPPAPRKR
jgi:ATP-dependent helicase HrpB